MRKYSHEIHECNYVHTMQSHAGIILHIMFDECSVSLPQSSPKNDKVNQHILLLTGCHITTY